MDVSQYGSYLYGESIYSATVATGIAAVDYLDGRFGLRVGVYEQYTGVLKQLFDSDVDESPLASASFDLVETGCGAFSFTLNTDTDILIERNDRVDIHLMHSTRPWYSGRVTEVPSVITDRKKFVYKGYGFSDLFSTIRVNQVYQNLPVEYVVQDLAEKYLSERDIFFSSESLMPVGYDIKGVDFDRITFKDAFKKLADLAHNYVYGVDEDRRLFFKPREGRSLANYSNKSSWWIGYGADSFKMKEQTSKIINKLYVKIGTVTDGSNFTDFAVSDLDSIAFFGEHEKVVTAPELKDSSDAWVWAGYQLETDAWPKLTAQVKGLDVANRMKTRDDLLRAEGHLRVSMPRSGLAATYYEPLNGYYRYAGIGTAVIYAADFVKGTFTCRKNGSMGRIKIMGRRIGSPGVFFVSLRLNGSVVETVQVAEAATYDWFAWITAEFEKTVYAGQQYEIWLYAIYGSSTDYYEICWSDHDAPFTEAYYDSANYGSSWTEDSGKGLIFRSWLLHRDEFSLPIKKVTYTADARTGISANVDLGDVEQPLENVILNLLREIKTEELLQQSNLSDLSL